MDVTVVTGVLLRRELGGSVRAVDSQRMVKVS
jgi:hypothetical protein